MKVATLDREILERSSELKQQIEIQKHERKSIIDKCGNFQDLPCEEMKNIEGEINLIDENIRDKEELLHNLSYYCQLECEINAHSLHKHGFDDWFRIKKMHKYFTKKDKPLYEAFVEGWLRYFEKYGSINCNEDRTLFFDWGHTREGEFDLIIYLKPLHNRNYFDYKYFKHQIENQLNQFEMQGYAGTAENKNMVRSPLPQPPSTTDPHPPPPPPPPQAGKTQTP
jgi:hypothetical protein